MRESRKKLESHPLFDLVKIEVEALYASIQRKLADGLSVMEIFQLVGEALTSIRNIVGAINAAPESKRELAILLTLDCWEEFVVPIDLPGNLDMFVDPTGRMVLPTIVGVLYDLLNSKSKDIPPFKTVS